MLRLLRGRYGTGAVLVVASAAAWLCDVYERLEALFFESCAMQLASNFSSLHV